MWEYMEKYNALGEFNPRLIACDNCSEYLEPEFYSDDLGWCTECNQYMNGEIE